MEVSNTFNGNIAGLRFHEKQSSNFETGFFIPSLCGDGVAGSPVYHSRSGYYTRINNMCFININLSWVGHNGDGSMIIDMLPFNPKHDTPLTIQSIGFYVQQAAVIKMFDNKSFIQLTALNSQSDPNTPVMAQGSVLISGFFEIL